MTPDGVSRSTSLVLTHWKAVSLAKRERHLRFVELTAPAAKGTRQRFTEAKHLKTSRKHILLC